MRENYFTRKILHEHLVDEKSELRYTIDREIFASKNLHQLLRRQKLNMEIFSCGEQ